MLESVVNIKREKFRVDLRKQNLDGMFRKKRLQGIQNNTPTITDTQLDYYLTQALSNGSHLNNIQEILTQVQDSEEHLTQIINDKLHIKLVMLLSKTTHDSNFICQILRTISNMIYYCDDVVTDLYGYDVFALLCRLSCQNEDIYVSQIALSALGNYVSVGQSTKITLLRCESFFEFWVYYLKHDENIDCVKRRSSRLLWVLVNLVDVENCTYSDFIGCLVIVKLIISKISFAEFTLEGCLDLFHLMRRILKKGSKLEIADAFENDLYKELIEIVKVSEGMYDNLNEARFSAARVVKTIAKKLETNMKIQLYSIGIGQTLQDLLKDKLNLRRLGFVLKLLATFCIGDESTLVDMMFVDYESLLQILLDLLNHSSSEIVEQTLYTIYKAIEYGSHQIYNNFLQEDFFYKVVPLLDLNQHCDVILDIISCCLQKSDSMIEQQQKYVASKLQQQNVVAIIEKLIARTQDDEIWKKCNELLTIINEEFLNLN